MAGGEFNSLLPRAHTRQLPGDLCAASIRPFAKHKTMKPKNVIVGLCLLATAAGLAFSGCKSVTTVTTNADGTFTTNTVSTLDTNRVDRACKQAAIDGTTDVLRVHPEWRPQFQQAEDDLNAIANNPSPSIDDILAIAQRLPVKELRSETAVLSFQAGQFALSLFDVPQASPTAAADIQSVARAMADGVAQGISNAPPVPVKPPTPIRATNAPAN